MIRREKSQKPHCPKHSLETGHDGNQHRDQKRSSTGPAVNNQNPPEEWQPCSDGFQVWSREQAGGVIRARNIAAEHRSGVVKSQRQFGQKWIQSEELLQISPCSSTQTPRSGLHVSDLKSALKLSASSPTTAEEADLDSICWNSSDSDTEETKVKKQRIFSPPAKRQRTQKYPPRKTKPKRNSAKFQNVPGAVVKPEREKSGGPELSEDEILLSASESEDERTALSVQGASRQSGGSQSPVLQIEYMGSPQRISSSTPEESGHFEIRDPDDESPQDDSSCKEAQVPEGTTPSISSCASSQRTGDSDLSPGPGGLRVIEWARQMKWETTPTKQEPVTPPHQADSGKKRKKFAKGGLAERMCRILQREKSARSVWQHQHKPEASAQGAGSNGVVVRVRHLETAYGVKLTRCTVLASPASVHLSTNVQCSVLFSSPSAKQKAVIKQGATVHIFPPWHQVDTAGGALLCTRYHVRGHSSCHDRSGGGGGGVSDGDTSAAVSGLASSPAVSGLASSPAVSGLASSPVVTHGRWMCPCSADTSLPATKCPAYLFPFLPSSITQAPTAAPSREPSATGKALHTVTLSEGAPKRTLTFSTLLESIERAPSGDRLLPPFQATVLRVFQEQGEAQSLRHCVLVEDSQGTVAMVIGATQLSPHLEGCLCSFSCLRVHSRTNADRDPALFSAVCGAWSDRGKTTAAPSTSQDSDSVSHSDHSQLASRPPGFCYLLEVDPGACSVVEGGDWLTVSSSPSTSSPPPLMLTSLAEALQSQKQGRISVLSKFLYFSSKQSEKEEISGKSSNQNSSQTPAVLYITDHSLQKRHIVDSEDSPVKQDKDLATAPVQGLEEERKLPAFVRVDVRAECVTRDMARENARSKKSRPALVLLRDVWFVTGSWMADKYSSLLISSEADRGEAATLTARIEPSTHRAVSECGVTFPALCAASRADSLVSVSGVVQSVDERSAFSWEECDKCGSDQLATRTGSQSLLCLRCKKPVSHPVQKMKMDVTVRSDADRSLSVTISLQQSTIEELLPDEEEEEGYEVDCVLNKAVGPVNCILTSTTPSATGLTMTAVQLHC